MEINIDTGKAILVVSLTIVGVIIINVLMYFMIVRSGTIGQVNLMRKAAGKVRNPWQDEDDGLAELSKLVEQLKDQPSNHSDDEENKSPDE